MATAACRIPLRRHRSRARRLVDLAKDPWHPKRQTRKKTAISTSGSEGSDGDRAGLRVGVFSGKSDRFACLRRGGDYQLDLVIGGRKLAGLSVKIDTLFKRLLLSRLDHLRRPFGHELLHHCSIADKLQACGPSVVVKRRDSSIFDRDANRCPAIEFHAVRKSPFMWPPVGN